MDGLNNSNMENTIQEAAKQYAKHESDEHLIEEQTSIKQVAISYFEAGANWAMKVYNETTTSTGTVFADANTPKDNKSLEELKEKYANWVKENSLAAKNSGKCYSDYGTALEVSIIKFNELIDSLPHLQTKPADVKGIKHHLIEFYKMLEKEGKFPNSAGYATFWTDKYLNLK